MSVFVFKTEKTEITEQTVSVETDDRSFAATNVDIDNAHYKSGDELILKSENKEANVSGSTKVTENKTSVSTVNQEQTAGENALDIHIEQIHRNGAGVQPCRQHVRQGEQVQRSAQALQRLAALRAQARSV